MASVAIVYFSAQGHTHQMAEAVAEGAKGVAGTTVELVRLVAEDMKDGRWSNPAALDTLTAADAIVFGTPTYMGGYSAQMKMFIDAASGIWYKQGWKDKLAAGFTHSAALSGDKLATLNGFVINAMQHSMVWVGVGLLPGPSDPGSVNRLGSFTGAMAQTNQGQDEINPGDRETAVALGRRVAETAARLGKGK